MSKVKCIFCDKEENYNGKKINSTKHVKDKNEGKFICYDCFHEQGYFECEQCRGGFKLESYGGKEKGTNGACKDCFKGR